MTAELLSLLKSGDKRQLICFPYLGGYANSFLPFLPHFEESCEVWGVTLPGHGGNSSLPLQDLSDVVAILCANIKKIIRPNCIFIGHSMGAIVAYFLLQKMLFSEPDCIQPKALILSASPVPDYFADKKLSELSDKVLLARLQLYGGLSAEILKEQGLMTYFLPTYRADFKVLESAATHLYQAIQCPVYYFWGENDRIVSLKEALRWRSYVQGDIRYVSFAAAPHMFIQSKASEMVQQIEAVFSRLEDHVYWKSTQDELC